MPETPETAETPASPALSGAGDPGWRLAARLVLREARGRPGALWLLFVCVCLGVLAIAGVGSLAQAIHTGLAAQGQVLLGGDIDARFTGRQPSAAEAEALRRVAVRTSDSLRLRAMLRLESADAAASQLVELKAVDGNWPLYGTAETDSGGDNRAVQQALRNGVVLSDALAQQLHLKRGDRVSIGEAQFPVSAILLNEPDRAGEGFAMGPSALIAMNRLAETGLIQPGSLYRWHRRLMLPENADPAAVIQQLQAELPESGWQLHDRRNGAPGIRRFVDMVAQFLTLVSLAALAIAGVGVSNGVQSQLARRMDTIATLKVLGATTRLVQRIYLLLVLAVATTAALAGAALGALVPAAVARFAGDALPVPPASGIFPAALALAMAYGLLVALAFALRPLARASALPPARIFRSTTDRPGRLPARTLLGVGAAAAGIILLALWQSTDKGLAAIFLLGTAATLALLYAAGVATEFLARRCPRPASTIARLALSNMHRPGNFTRQLIVALGLGLGLFAMLALVETSLNASLDRTVPEKAPAFFLLDLPKDEVARFQRAVPAGNTVRLVPSLRGPVTAVNEVPATELQNVPAESYVLNGDRGLTFAADVPEGNHIVAGQWWPHDYAGPPLVSMEAEQARLLGLQVGDRLTVSVLGVPITAEIASLRAVDWDSFGFNFVLVFDPATLAAAPYSYMATITPTPGHAFDAAAFANRISAEFPTSSLIRVDDVLDRISTLLQQMGLAIRAAAAVAILAGIAVLVGALAAQARLRGRDNVILKLLGASRRQLMLAAALEYAVLAMAVAAIAGLAGAVAAWAVVTHILDLDWQPDWWITALTVLAGGLLTFLLGMLASWRTLGIRIAAALREL